jgi:hypothetical protein
MKILICGVGAIGSNLVRNLIPDLKGEHEITVLDMDIVEKRNVTPGTQWFTPDQIGLPKVEALQYNVYQTFQREVEPLYKNFPDGNWENDKLDDENVPSLWGAVGVYDLVIDCFDNHQARKNLQDSWRDEKNELPEETASLLHIGFSDQFTFEIEWAENYQVPTDITTGMDICEMEGAAGFVNSVAALGALVVEKFIWNHDKMRVLGGKYQRSFVS